MEIVENTLSDGVSGNHSMQMLTKFQDVQEAIGDSDLRLIYKLNARVNVGDDQVTYYVSANDEVFIVVATDLEDGVCIVSCDRARREPADWICYVEQETDSGGLRAATHYVIEECVKMMREMNGP